MAILTIGNLSNDANRELRARAVAHGRSTEAEVCDILQKAVKSAQHILMDDVLARIGRRIGFTNDEIENIKSLRNRITVDPRRFEDSSRI